MSVKAKHFIHKHYAWTISLTILVAVTLATFFYMKGSDWPILLSIIGGLFSFIYFIQKQQLEEAKLFKELFIEFNKRYDELNDKLNHILTANTELSGKDIDTLYDYFNLCAEEYLFYRKGYSYPEVWAAWCDGMSHYLKHEEIERLWLDEQRSPSYYGLTLDKIRKSARVASLPSYKGISE